MALTLIIDTGQALVEVREKLWLTADKDRAVPDGHPDAAFLLVPAGGQIERFEAERLGLLDEVKDAEATADDHGDEEPTDDQEASEEEPSEDAEATADDKPAGRRRRAKGSEE